jgi:hypothetical protein
VSKACIAMPVVGSEMSELAVIGYWTRVPDSLKPKHRTRDDHARLAQRSEIELT